MTKTTHNVGERKEEEDKTTEPKEEQEATTESSSNKKDAIVCSTCQTPQTESFVLKKCSCRAAQYCNTKCQKQDRKTHKEICRRLTAERKLEKKQNKLCVMENVV